MITTTIGFEVGSLSPSLVSSIVSNVIRFRPDRVRVAKRNFKFKDWDDFKTRIGGSSDSCLDFYVTGEVQGLDFGLYLNSGWELYGLYWTQPELEESECSLIESLVEHPKFHSGFSSDDETLVLTDLPEDRVPSRQTTFPGLWLAAGWKNWYGSWAFGRLNRDRIREFSPTYETRELPGGGLYVALTRGPFDPELPGLQSKFWLDTGLSELEEEYFRMLEQE